MAKRPNRNSGVSRERIRQHIRAQSQAELADLVCSLVERYSDLRDEFAERVALSKGDVERLVELARKEIRRVTAEPAWRSGWTGQGNTPDYSRIKHRLERLAETGHADAVVRLGRELIERGMGQIEQSNDEGDTAQAFATCVPVIFAALTKSTLAAAAKLQFVIDACLEDQWDLLGADAEGVLDHVVEPEAWSTVADALAGRLETMQKPQPVMWLSGGREPPFDFARDHKRDCVTDWLALALRRAGRGGEVKAIFEAEARRTGSYHRLVRYLIEQKQEDEARRWTAEGIERTARQLPGIASSLADEMCEIAARNEQWDVVAAHAAAVFFERPDAVLFDNLVAAAGKANVADAVRAAAEQFLETGVLPVAAARSADHGAPAGPDARWPLPTPAYLAPLYKDIESRRDPFHGVLIDIAIRTLRPDAVLKWYDRWIDQATPAQRAHRWSEIRRYVDRVADAVRTSHPQRAIEMYRAEIERNLPDANPRAYEAIVGYLGKLRPVYASIGDAEAWDRLILGIRERYGNRPKFMGILDQLDRDPDTKPKVRQRR